MATPKVGAGSSTDINAPRAAAEAADEATSSFGDDVPNLVVAFISDEHREFAEDVAGFLGERFPGAAVIGCVATGVIAGGREYEQGPVLSLFAAFLPDTHVVPFGLQFVEAGDGEHAYVGWPDMLAPDATIITLCDRFSFPIGHFLSEMNETRPGQLVTGGIATGGDRPGEGRLFYGGQVFTEGAVAVAVSGRVRVETLVSQGCRPVGDPATVTRADRNIIFEIAGERPVDHIGKLWRGADPRTRQLLQQGPQLGIVVDEYKTDFEPGDFIVRPVMGADAETGVIAVGDMIDVGATVQFHVRDPESADEDLHRKVGSVGAHPAGALLFTCNGRGMNLFDVPNHDAAVLSDRLAVPLGGMFCAGEIGPVGGRNFLHGQTASVAMFVDTEGS